MRVAFHPAARSAAFLISIVLCFGILTFLFATAGRAQIPINGLVAKYDFNLNADNSASGPAAAPNGTIFGASPTQDRWGNLNSAYAFNGTSNYIEIPDSDAFSLTTTGSLSISVWVRPDGTTLDPNGRLLFSHEESTGYVHWMGKGFAGEHEWSFRIYSADNTDIPYRANRLSYYLFNRPGGLGAGSYAQDDVVPGEWIHFVAVVRTSNETITFYKNGVQRDQDSFAASSNFPVAPENGSAPLRIGTRDFQSYFAGAVDDLRIYNRALTTGEIQQLFSEQAGDFNSDRSVDAADYAVWRKGYAQADYNTWRANFGRTTGGAATSWQIAADPNDISFVPEPISVIPLLIGILGLRELGSRSPCKRIGTT
jgi:hypothetical protein